MKEYVLIGSFNIHYVYDNLCDLGKMTWRQDRCPKSIKAGDIVYIYETEPIKAIRWKCRVTKINFYGEVPGESDYAVAVSDQTHDGPDVPVVLLEALFEYPCWHLLSLEKLQIANGGKKVCTQRSYEPNARLARYIHRVEKQQISDESLSDLFSKASLSELRKLAIHSKRHPVAKTIEAKQYNRSRSVSEYAKRRAGQYCELCKEKAPFFDKYGSPYLETHHVKPLSKGGDDSIYNTVALCPNCHRKMHIIKNKSDVGTLLQILKLDK